MARIKPKNTITTKAQAEAAMAKLNGIDQSLARMDLDEAESIANVREKHQARQREAGRPGLEAEKALLVKELEAWADTDSETWPKKTMETPFGSLGFRVGNPAVVLIKKVAKNFDAALTLLQARLSVFVRQVPQIDKEQILALARDEERWPDYEGGLATCGLAVKQDDEFWIETNASKDLEAAAQKLRAA